ncbi:MAG: RNA polymerase factor sigma-54 [Cystobacterineae bacterium]|nr:RNA polymerase factor sigma-54 [Cystobacterineae bacterium]
MAMEMRQSLKLAQQLVMTPQLQQAIKLLQLSQLELLEQLQEEIEQNPVLEATEEKLELEAEHYGPGELSLEADMAEAPADFEPPVPENAPEYTAQDNPPEMDWDAFLNSDQFREALPEDKGKYTEQDESSSFESHVVKGTSLFEHLLAQVRLMRFNDAEQRIALLILGNLNDDGYLVLPALEGDPLIALAHEADVPLWLAERVLQHIQRLEPLGCAARDLQECLLLQLKTQPSAQTRLLSTIIKRHLKLLESTNLPAIAKEMKVPLAQIVECSKLLKTLNPKPGRNHSGEDAPHITPDVYIYKHGESYTIVLNDNGLSKLRISHTYRNALRQGSLSPGATKNFVQEKLKSALWLIRSIHQRQRTIYKVTESLIKFQLEFLEKGVDHLKPLILRDIAEDIGMHESTISRATTNKYVHTPQGIFELKYFFNSSISSSAGGEELASQAVKSHLRQLVAQEHPQKPYSDQKLAELLQAKGIDIARRTIAKYREMLGILPSSKRKRYF